MVYQGLLSVFVAFSSFAVALAGTRSYELDIVNKFIAPDGFSRDTVLANGQFPGTLITANKGDTLAVNVVNKLKNLSMDVATTIHWHGLFQQRTAHEDGTADVTQCPISPDESFLYQFNVQQQTGTYWYHSHFGTQYCDGLRGPLVIYDPEDPLRFMYDVDDENTIITLADWYHLPVPAVFNIFGNPDSTLINGLGRSINDTTLPLAVVNVRRGLWYRMRLINMACFSFYTFQIDEHKLTVIEADGVETQPVTVDSLDIHIAQRYSFILQADQPVGNYFIRANPQGTGQPTGFAGGANTAILRYEGAPKKDPTTKQVNGTALQEPQLHTLVDPGSPGGDREADIKINLDINVNFSAPIPLFTINNITYFPPTVPVLLQILSGAINTAQLQPNGSIYVLPRNKLVEVTIPGGSLGFPHPFHLHGTAFDVVRSAGSNVTNFKNPVRRDVVNTGGPGSNMTFRFETINPGPWFLHCHINWHLQGGLAVVFVEAPEDIITGPDSSHPPKAWDELCPKFQALPAPQRQEL